MSSEPSLDWVAYVTGVTDIACGVAHSCALRSAGDIMCWGFRNEGQLGDGTTDASLDPVRVMALDDAVAITAGATHNCAVTASRRAACWGDNDHGQIGDGTGGVSSAGEDRLVPTYILDEVERVSAGLEFSCALGTDGRVLCWGYNGNGAVGNGRPDPTRLKEPSPVPILAPEGVTFVDVSAGVMGSHACALTAGGVALCWGSGSMGQLGYGGSREQWNEPVPAGPVGAALDELTAIAAGTRHTCAIRAGREVWCWGANDAGQLGDGTREDRYAPVRVVGLE